MNRLSLLLMAILLCLWPSLTMASQDEVRVSLFTKYHPKVMLVEPAGEYKLNGQKRRGPFQIQLQGENILLEGAVVSSLHFETAAPFVPLEINRQKRVNLPSRWNIKPYKGELAVTGQVPREEYVAAVVQAELGAGPPAALAAQAILVRTYLAANAARHAERRADLCDLTHCQVYRSGPLSAEALTAAKSTSGVILVDSQGQPAQAFYSSTCGGQTVAPAVIWPGADHDLVGIRDYLPGEKYPLCRYSPHSYWVAAITKEELKPILREQLGRPVVGEYSITVDTVVSGVVTKLQLRQGNATYQLAEARFRQLVGRHLGWQRLKSATYELVDYGTGLFFYGHGLGHQVGLCQYGASQLAQTGAGAEEILGHYFPRLKLVHYWE